MSCLDTQPKTEHLFCDSASSLRLGGELDWGNDDLLKQAIEQAELYIAENPHDFAQTMSCKSSVQEPNEALPNESIWDKFDLLDYVLDDCTSPLDSLSEEDLPAEIRLSSSLDSNPSPISEMRHHDCMWAGHCRHEEHGDMDTLNTPPSSPTFDICAASPVQPSSKPLVTRPTNSRSLLVPRTDLFRSDIPSKFTAVATKNIFPDIGHRPDTPQSELEEPFHMRNMYPSAKEEEDSETDSIQSSSEENDDCPDDAIVHSRYVNHGTSYITDHTYVRPPFRQPVVVRQPTTDSLGLCTPSDSEEEIDVVSVQQTKMPEATTIIEEQQQKLSLPTKRAKLTPTKRSARQSARAARASTLASKRNSQSHEFQEELQQSLIAMAAEASKDVTTPPLRMRLQHSSTGAKRRKNVMATPPHTSSSSSSSCSSSGSSSDSSSEDTPTPKRSVKRSRLSKKTSSSSRKRSATSARSSSDSEDRSGKRTMHNTMERQRRVDLRNAFETLRQAIPDLENSEKAPKVTILREASNYCMSLQQDEARLERQRTMLMKEQAVMRQRLAAARRSHASTRR